MNDHPPTTRLLYILPHPPVKPGDVYLAAQEIRHAQREITKGIATLWKQVEAMNDQVARLRMLAERAERASGVGDRD